MLSVMNTKTIEGDVVKVVQHASVDTDKQLAGIKIKKDNGDVMELELPSKMANVVVTKHSYQRSIQRYGIESDRRSSL